MEKVKVVLINTRYTKKNNRLVNELRDKGFQVNLFAKAEEAYEELIFLINASYIVFDPNGLASRREMYGYIDKFIYLSEGAATLFLVVDTHMLDKTREKLAHLDMVKVILFQNIKRSLIKEIQKDKESDVIPF